MGIFNNWYTREPRKELDLNAPPKTGLALFFSVLWRELWELCKLNLVFLLFCIPVVTIPAAITSMSRVIMLMLMDRPVYVFSEFLETFKKEWKRASAAGLPFFLLVAFTLVGQYIYSSVMGLYALQIATLLLCALLIMAGFYLFPMLAMLDVDLRGVIKNAVLLTFLRLPYNLLALLAVGAITFLILLLFPSSILIIIPIYFSLTNFITTFCAYTGLKKFVFKEEQEQQEE